MVTDRVSRVELEHRLSSLQTSLDAIERAITRHKNTLEDCRMQEEEARREEAISQGWEEGDADVEMMEELMEEEERKNGEPSEPQGAAETEEVPPSRASTGDAVSPEEHAFLMQQASQPVDPAAGSHSPRIEAGTVSGEMADLSLTSPGQPEPGEDETP